MVIVVKVKRTFPPSQKTNSSETGQMQCRNLELYVPTFTDVSFVRVIVLSFVPNWETRGVENYVSI